MKEVTGKESRDEDGGRVCPSSPCSQAQTVPALREV